MRGQHLQFYPLSEGALTVSFATGIHDTTNTRIRQLMNDLDKRRFPGYIEAVPSYTGVTVFFDPAHIAGAAMKGSSICEKVECLLRERIGALGESEQASPGKTIAIPVCYGGDYGPDLAAVAAHNHLSVEDVINRHCAGDYLVYMIGFAPGFPFLGGMDPGISAPRRKQPRAVIPAGTVGIAGGQTGVYPLETPGGWQLIGRTPLVLFDPERKQPSLLAPGDRVRFEAISAETYEHMKEAGR
ncbi:MAG: 5-oxoprolinase subunit PxpB [Shouchella clausii]|jgi:inhibitor of KinA